MFCQCALAMTKEQTKTTNLRDFMNSAASYQLELEAH